MTMTMKVQINAKSQTQITKEICSITFKSPRFQSDRRKVVFSIFCIGKLICKYYVNPTLIL